MRKETREERLQIRVSRKEKLFLEGEAKAVGKTTSNFVRDRALHGLEEKSDLSETVLRVMKEVIPFDEIGVFCLTHGVSISDFLQPSLEKMKKFMQDKESTDFTK